MSDNSASGSIKSIDAASVHRITSGQVVIDLQTAVKELVENSLDAGATSIEVRFKNYGLNSIEVIDNGSGIAEGDHDSIGRKHHTSKLSSFNDLTMISSFGFRGEALSSLCALCESVTVTTATVEKAPMGTVLEMAKSGEVAKKAKAVRQRGTSVLLKSPFAPLPVRRKELERNVKREFGKALALLNAYALGPCCGLGPSPEANASDTSADIDANGNETQLKPVRLIVTNQPDKGQKTTHISIPLPRSGAPPSVKIGITALWGPKALDGVIDLDLKFEVPKIVPRSFGRKQAMADEDEARNLIVRVHGLISSPVPVPASGSSSRSGSGRSGTDRQFFYVNGRPCGLTKIQKVFNETYRSFSPSAVVAAQFPFIVANFTVDGDTIDINVTPDKRTVLLHAESHIVDALKTALEELFQPSRSTFGVNGNISVQSQSQTFGNQRSASMRPPATAPGMLNQAALNRSASTGSRRRGSIVVSRSAEEDEEVEVDGERNRVGNAENDVENADCQPTHSTAGRSVDKDTVADKSVPSDNATSSASSKRISLISTLDEDDTSPIPPSATPPLSKALVAALDASKEKKSSVVLKTTNAAWNYIQTSGSASCSTSAPAPAMTIQPPDAADTHTNEDDEPPRKRRRWSAVPNGSQKAIGTAAPGEDMDDIDVEEASVVLSSSNSKGKGIIPTYGSRVTKSVPSSTAGAGEGGLRQTTLTASFKGTAARKDMRSKLTGFARVGSQVRQPSSDAEEEEEVEEDQIVEDSEDDDAGRSNDDKPKETSVVSSNRRRREEAAQSTAMDEDPPLFLPGEDDEMDVDHDATSSSVDSLNTSSVNGPPSSTLATSTLLSSSSGVIDLADDDELGEVSSSLLSVSERDQQLSESHDSQPVDRPEVIRTASSQTSQGDVHLRFNLSRITYRWSVLREKLQAARERSTKLKDDMIESRKQTLNEDEEQTQSSDDLQEPEAKLSRVIDKKDFEKMDVLGQFNLGFIIVRRRKLQHGDRVIEGDISSEGEEDAVSLDDLFIVDQHAADEKYNFETLQQSTIIQSQRLFRPQTLELTASDELVAIENLDVLKRNGFELEVREDPDSDVEMLGDESSGSQMRGRLSLVAQPVSKSTMFDVKDLEELIHLLQDRPTGQMVRCSKARAMFASRACRKSVMVGMPLTKGQMTTVVHHMGTMDQPWNCPHGRPTMRHLFDMSNIKLDSEPSPRVRKKVDWSMFA